MMKTVCGGVVRECALMYGFDADEALSRMYESMKDKKPEKMKKIELPFLGTVKPECCKAVRMNGGLYTQCEKQAEQYCLNCLKDELPYGTMEERVTAGADFKDNKGRKPMPYAKYLEKAKVSQEDVIAYATSIGIELPESVFEMPVATPKKEKEIRGRPKKSGKVVEVDSSEDLFAGLVQSSINEVVVNSNEEDDKALAKAEKAAMQAADKEAKALALAAEKAAKAEKLAAEKEVKAVALAAEKAEKAAKLEAEKAAKAEKLAAEKALAAQEKEAKAVALAAEKAEKAAKLEAEKAEKAAKLEAEKTAKAEKLAAEKAEKAAKLEAEKAAKAEKLAAEKEAKKAKKEPKASKKSVKTPEVSDTEDEEEEEVEVKKFEFGGKKYLKSSKNVLYDAETQDEIGIWNEAKQEIEFAELEEEEEEE